VGELTLLNTGFTMPQHVLNMLDELIDNGSDEDSKILAAGVKETLKILEEDVVPEIRSSIKHREDTDLHTPKGLLVRGQVIAWFVFFMFLIATLVMYIPDGVAWLKALP